MKVFDPSGAIQELGPHELRGTAYYLELRFALRHGSQHQLREIVHPVNQIVSPDLHVASVANAGQGS